MSKNKNIDHGAKETCAMATKVTYEIDHICLLRDSKILSKLNFCFLMYFIVI